MGKISTYYKKQKMLDQLQKEIQQLEEDKELKQELNFKEELRSLMQKYDKSGREMLEVLAALDPAVQSRVEQGGSGSDGRRKRPLKTYRNPHTGEVVETRGGNQKTLNAWREQYGREEVARWQED